MTIIVPGAVLQQANVRSKRLRELVDAPEILVMPGAFDTITALLFQSMGFQAIQGTSGGIAAQHGLHDGEYFAREPTVEVYQHMVQAVDVPVNADGVKGFGGPEEVQETVRLLVRVGLSGMNLEDSDYRQPGEPSRLVELDAQREKIQAVMDAKRSLGSEFFLNARVDAFPAIPDHQEALKEAVKRGNSYAQLGADCIFYLRAGGADTIRTLVNEVHAPVSILADASSPSANEMEEIGVARVSYGAAFLRVALASMRRFGETLLEKRNPATVLEQAFATSEMGKLLRYELPK